MAIRRSATIFVSEEPGSDVLGQARRVNDTRRFRWWQSTKIGARRHSNRNHRGLAPVLSRGNDDVNGLVYSIGARLLRPRDSRQSPVPDSGLNSWTPEKPYETTGFVPNVVFPCATMQDAATGRIALYYGAADTYVASRPIRKLDELVAYLKQNSELVPAMPDAFR